MKRVDRSTRRVLMHVGGFVRTVARRSIRKRAHDKYSKPGNPPFSHGEGRLRNGIFFGADGDRAVVIGPQLDNGSRSTAAGQQTVPSLLEFGGGVPARGQLIAIDGGVRRDERGQFVSGKTFVKATRAIQYEPRPYMGPALEKGAERFPKLFADSVR